jgi:hypothetical protein
MTMIFTTLLAAASLCGSPAQVQARPSTSENTAEGAEILRRILVDALDDALSPKEKADAKDRGESTRIQQLHGFGVVTKLWSDGETVQHSRVFHLPDVGLFFALDAALPVVSKEREEREPDKASKSKDDEWERARSELRGNYVGGQDGLFLKRYGEAKETEIDPKAIELVIEQVLKTLARHAARIEGMTQRETFTVALRLSGRSRTLWSKSGSDGYEFEEGEGETHVWSSEEEGEIPSRTLSFVLAGGGSAREQNLVIRISLADLAGYAEGGPESLRQRAQINRY